MKTLDQIMALIENHLARANHPTTPPAEADLARKQAEKLMAKYRVEEWEAMQAGEAPGLKPVWHTVPVAPYSSEFFQNYYSLAYRVAYHAQVRAHYRHDFVDGEAWLLAEVCGYESDVRYAEMLFAGVRLAFGANLEPTLNPEADEADEAYRLRRGGMERKRIALAMLGSWETENEMKAKTRKVTALIKKGAEQAGEPWEDVLGRGNNIKVFRRSYAEAFVATIGTRLSLLRSEFGQTSSAIVLSSRKDSVEEAYYERYPNERPVKVAGTLDAAPCRKCQKAKGGYCRDHKPLRGNRYTEAYSSAGAKAGRASARKVDLGATPARGVR